MLKPRGWKFINPMGPRLVESENTLGVVMRAGVKAEGRNVQRKAESKTKGGFEDPTGFRPVVFSFPSLVSETKS